MKNRFSLLLLFFCVAVQAQNFQSPSEFLGYELGSRFTPHFRVVDYYQYVAKAMPNMASLKEYGRTYENRILQTAILSSPSNMLNLENIRKAHLESTKGEVKNEIAIVWLSYNVHGNESVSTEASMQTIYELLTSKKNYLDTSVVIIDPCINPDGRDRYVSWYNQNVNQPNNVDPNSVEHHEPWLSGRPNHYMFDLNRDWAWITQKESAQRLKVYNQWLPHVHVDFHEQGVNNPYYFAPAAEPYHEAITNWQRKFQQEIGDNHAKYFDKEGWFYFTKEIFDLLYPSYGDTYPMYNGSIGMTYEQGGSGRAGLGVITAIGDTLTLSDRIAHHHTTGLSTVEVAMKNHKQLNAEFRKFYSKNNYKYKNYVVYGNSDKIEALRKLLDAHQISYSSATNSQIKGYNYSKQKEGISSVSGSNLVVSTKQTKGTLVDVLFEPNTKVSDSLTYDITAWNLPFAYGLQAVATNANIAVKTFAKAGVQKVGPNAMGYIARWNSMKDARFLAELLKEGIRVRHNHEKFRQGNLAFDRGSLMVLKHDNPKGFDQRLLKIAEKHQIQLYASNTGMVNSGKDFGSSSVKMIAAPKVAVARGQGVSTLSFGEVWHFMEQQLQYPMTALDMDYISRVDLEVYDVLVLPNGWYGNQINSSMKKKLKAWVRNGGNLVAIAGAVGAITGDDGFALKENEIEEKQKDSNVPKPYNAGNREYMKQTIIGAIFEAKVDTTNPLTYGYDDTYFTLKLSAKSYAHIGNGSAVYLENRTKPVNGFAGSEAQKKIKNSLVFGTDGFGKGNVVYLIDNPLFRGFWENGKLFFVNALFQVD
ncbi:MAG: M14 family metallopeptidase [Flavobacteriaceae bacterium]|nr:M14 family metallopeptidase [Flavobacteriaceae bacterium]